MTAWQRFLISQVNFASADMPLLDKVAHYSEVEDIEMPEPIAKNRQEAIVASIVDHLAYCREKGFAEEIQYIHPLAICTRKKYPFTQEINLKYFIRRYRFALKEKINSS